MKTFNNEKVVKTCKVEDDIFRLTVRHLYIKDGDEYRELCDSVCPIADTIFPDGRKRGRRIRFRTTDGTKDELTIPCAEFMNPKNVVTALVNVGFPIPPNTADAARIGKFLSKLHCSKRIRQVDSSGWNSVDHNGSQYTCFAMGTKVIGSVIDGFSVESLAMDSDDGRFATKGTKEEWRKYVGKQCRGNPRLIFAVSQALGAPLVLLSGVEPDIVHFVGKPAVGKTTMLFVAASLFGEPEKYCIKWQATETGMEATCRLYNDLPLAVDELGQASPETLFSAIYMVAGGNGKVRGNTHAGLKLQTSFRNKVLSAGEISVGEQLSKANKDITAGQEIRMLGIPVRAKSFKSLHDEGSTEEFATSLKRNARRFYGTVGHSFIQHIVDNRKEVKNRLTEDLPRLVRYLEGKVADIGITDAEKRVLRRFALPAFAGKLATELGLTGWQTGESKEAVAGVLRFWLTTRRREPALKQQAIVDGIGLALKESKVLYFKNLDGERPSDDTVYGHILNGEKVYLVPPEHFKKVVCKDVPQAIWKKALSDANLLVTDQDRLDKQVRLPGHKTKKGTFIVVRRTIITGTAEA